MLEVKTLGKLEIRDDDIVLSESEMRSPMLAKLLVRMLIYRGCPATSEELIDALYEESEIVNPAGALKNLMYRLRIILRDRFGRSDFIVTNRGSYQWNPDIDVSLDIERFEMLLEKNNTEAVGRDETVAIYEEAIGLYKGDFMPGIKMLYWVTPLAAYYRSLFLASVRELLVIYAEQGEHEKTEIVCADALRNNIVDETIYYYLINSRIKSGKIMLAMKTYETAIDIIGKELGVKKSKLLTKAYEELMAAQGGTDIAAIDDVANDLAEDKPEGVFLCGYHVFKEIYRLQIRRMLREGDTCQMLLLTLDSNASVSDKINAFRIGHAMERLEKILISSLRMCDIAARYNESQFVVLLPSCESQNCGVVADRIRYKFENDELVHNSIKLTVHSDELTPDGNSKMLEI